MPKWLKWALGLAFGCLGLVIVLVVVVSDGPTEIKSWKQWEKHRDYIKSFSENVLLSSNALEVYATANNYYKSNFYNQCDLSLPVCAEYRRFIKAASESSADGVLTPKESIELVTYQKELQSSISENEEKFKFLYKK